MFLCPIYAVDTDNFFLHQPSILGWFPITSRLLMRGIGNLTVECHARIQIRNFRWSLNVHCRDRWLFKSKASSKVFHASFELDKFRKIFHLIGPQSFSKFVNIDINPHQSCLDLVLGRGDFSNKGINVPRYGGVAWVLIWGRHSGGGVISSGEYEFTLNERTNCWNQIHAPPYVEDMHKLNYM